jgi:hypothetical protein
MRPARGDAFFWRTSRSPQWFGTMHDSSLRFCLAHSATGLSYLHYFLRLIGRRHCFRPTRAAFAPLEESKVVSSHPLMVNRWQLLRALVLALLLLLLSAASVSIAYGQEFTLTVASGPSPPAVDPGGTSKATINIAAIGGFDGVVSFDTVPCAVTPVQPTGTPLCVVSPDSATPPAQAFLTISTGSDTPPGLYSVLVTGASDSDSEQVTLTFNVVNVSESYTLQVSPSTATPSPVPAGSIATTIVTVFPAANYTGTVTLACFSVTPLVADPPYCSFVATLGSDSLPADTVQVTSGAPATATMTITTLGPTNITSLHHRRTFYALWLLIPGLALVGASANRTRAKRLLWPLLLLAVAGGLLLTPACNSTPITNSVNGRITPKNTYTFTVTGADQTGAPPSNVASSPQTVTLEVN